MRGESSPTTRAPLLAPASPRSDVTEANARLTSTTAIVLLLLLAAEGATLLAIHSLVKPHVFLGFAMIPPVVLKISSTTYRFARYYSGHAAYRRKGPPLLILRVLGPVVILTTVVLLGSGVALGTTHGTLQANVFFVHRASFVVWFVAMTVHVLGHAWETARMGARDWRPGVRATGATMRRWAVVSSVVVGVGLGAWGLAAIGPWSTHLSH